ncbi:MAG: hypothetical protein ABI036_03785 [Fibrobacteria bacterium]
MKELTQAKPSNQVLQTIGKGLRPECAAAAHASPWPENGFLPDAAVLASFLVNALYLFGDNTLIAHGGVPVGVADELTRLGHSLSISAPEAPGRQRGSRTNATGRNRGQEGRRGREGRHDRALLLSQALGVGSDGDILERLRALGRAIRPGGLVCFHIFDRDLAWILAGARFNPATGRVAPPFIPIGRSVPFPGRSVPVDEKTWNRSEIEALLRGVGLRLERVYGGWEGAGSEAAVTGRLIVVAAKPRRAARKVSAAARHQAA